MKLRVEEAVAAPSTKVWKVIANIENSANVMSAITTVEILEKPEFGLRGLKWTETRKMFGKEAKETMTVADELPGDHYMTLANSHGSRYQTKVGVTPSSDNLSSTVYMEFEATPYTKKAKLTWMLTGWMFKGATKKALQQDLGDIKKAVEA